MDVTMTLEVNGLRVDSNDAGISLESYDAGSDGWDMIASGDEVVKVLRVLLDFAEKHQPAKPLPKKG